MTSYTMTPGQELEAYVHQVSGRAHMLSLNKTTLCKSLAFREWKFYVTLPKQLQPFTPKLKGLLYVLLEKGNNNSHRFTTSGLWIPPPTPSGQISADEQLLDGASDPTMLRQTTFKGLDRMQYDETNGFTRHPWTIDKDQEALTEAVGKNPWSLRQHRREINRTLRGDTLRKEVDLQMLWEATSSGSDRVKNEEFAKMFTKMQRNGNYMKAYLLLDDVTSRYRFPCVVDLKIGTQLERSGCSDEKKDKHVNLTKMSSTGSIGIRLAGMQVFQATTGQFLCRDKYYGRGLSTEGFKEALRQFLHNGQRLVAEVIPHIIVRLKELRSVVAKQDSFRFYASSVLISYDGALNNSSDLGEHTPSKVGVHMIDFAHSTFKEFLDDKIVYDGPDHDCLVALDNLIILLGELFDRKSS